MEAVGRLSGGVAHDFNNILMIITGYGDLLKDRLGSDEQLRPMIEAILNAANRAASLTHQLLAFSRKQILSPKVLDLNSILADLDKMLPRLIGEDIYLEMVPGNGLGRVMADALQIQQVVMNLVVNARDAMPDGGKLTIETANAEWDEESGQEFGIEAKAGSFVLLSVADNGIGMDRETRAHLFEPFFTTKGVDKGTGLGLSIVYGIVKQSGGFIRVDSQPGQGTTFKIYLPRIEAKETATSAMKVPPKGRRGSETILLVEDEQGVREAISHFLRGQGYIVLEAHNPKVAIEIAQEQSKPIHLLMTDMIMPEMNGRELAKQLTATRPELSVLFISGYTDRGITGGATIDANTNFLQKPFGFDVLGRKLRDILDG
jgi:CheY-like chemotaxis protein/two-component sensor histidine kinase